MLEHILFVLLEAIITWSIINYVPYTEIDWTTYMQHIRLFIRGVRNYSQLVGDTGLAVYPAGYLYSFTILYALTSGGRDIAAGQSIFLVIYLLQCVLVAVLFRQCNIKPKWTILLMMMSKRIHSIYVLRLFNDCLSVLLMYVALIQMLSKSFMSATVFWSMSVSVKMSSLLYAPAIGLIIVKEAGWLDAMEMAAWFLLIQGFLAVPFLRRSSKEYLQQAFDFGRSFDYQWTVNWRFIPESLFQASKFKATLLVLHVSSLILIAQKRWLAKEGGLMSLFRRNRSRSGASVQQHSWSPRKMASILFECNLVGIIFARSLHYQHYSWYYHSVWLLLFMSSKRIPLLMKIMIALTIEYCWNVYPSTAISSLVLFACNLLILLVPRGDD